MDQNNNPLKPKKKNNNNPNKPISLDLSLNIKSSQEEEKQDGHVQKQDPINEQGNFIQLLTSTHDDHGHGPRATHHDVTALGHDNPFLALTTPVFLTYQPHVDNTMKAPAWAQPVQPNQFLEAPRVPRLGRPPLGQQARRNPPIEGAVIDKNPSGQVIIPPYPWATTKPATIHSLRYLSTNNINVISGQVQCRSCDKTRTLEYNLKEKYIELRRYIKNNKEVMRQRAQNVWMNPELTPCVTCQNGMRPVISNNDEEINWLFLLLGQMLGCCTLIQLRYFCNETSQHRTGAKDRVLYSTYIGLCKQLDPT
ncbi:unnamed protein product [Cochlearia groenlandica]